MKATIGRYIPGNTLVHKTNPILKLIINIMFIVFAFMIKSFILLAGLGVISISLFLISKLRIRQLFSIFLTTLFIGVFIFVFNMFIIKTGYGSQTDHLGNTRVDYFSDSSKGYFFTSIDAWKIKITDKVVFQTIFIMSRIYIMIIITTLTTATTKPKALTGAIEVLLLPLKLLFIPVHIIAMIISIALRFVPTLLEEAQRIMKAQASRGVDFKNGNIKTKTKAIITLIIPLFVSAFAKAEDLGNAMETRGYDPYEKRTKYRKNHFSWMDALLGLFVIGLLVFLILSKTDIIVHPWWWV